MGNLFVYFKQLLYSIFIFIFCIFSTQGLGFLGWQDKFSKYQIYGILLVPIFIVILNIVKASRYSGVWKNMMKYLILMPIISCFSKFILVGESPFSVMFPIYISLTFFSFYAFYVLKVNEITIIRALISVAVLTAIIQIYQVVTGIVLFDLYTSIYNYLPSERNGITRLFVGCPYIQLFCFFYIWQNVQEKFSVIRLALASLLLISLYLYLQRQLMVITLAVVFLSFIYSKKQSKRILIFLGITIISLLWNYWDLLFGSLVESSKGDEGFLIRFKSIELYTLETFSNFLVILFGAGQSHYEEKWARLGYYASDAGFAGDMFHYGVMWAVVYYRCVYLLLKKYSSFIPNYIRYFLIATLINSIFAFPYHSYDMAFVWVSMLYISALYINQIKKTTKFQAFKVIA